MGMHYKKGIGTLAYRDQWNLFDQFIVTSSLLDQKKNYNDLTFYRSVIFNKPFLKNKREILKDIPIEPMWDLHLWGDTATTFLYIYS